MAPRVAVACLLAACGSVETPEPDAGVDAGPPPDCSAYCDQVVKCAWKETRAVCCERCACIADALYRPEVASAYVRCVTDATECTDTVESDCLDVALEGVGTRDVEAKYASACQERRDALACGELDCGASRYWRDDVLREITPCLGRAECEAIVTCTTDETDGRCEGVGGEC